MAALVLMGVVLSGCDEVDNPVVNEPQTISESNVVTLTTTISLPGGVAARGTTRALDEDGHKTFEVGDKITVIYKNKITGKTKKAVSNALTAGDITGSGKSATFTVSLTNPLVGGAVRYIYPSAMAVTSVAEDIAVNDDATVNYALLVAQNGTLESLAAQYDLAIFDGTLTSTTELPAGTLKNKLAICAYTIKDETGTNDLTSTITEINISDGTNNYTIMRSPSAGPIYVAIRPTDNKNIEYKATDGTHYYAKSVTGKTYEANNMYPLGLRMTSTVTPVGLEAVDLGLPSGRKWANMNVGAIVPESYGSYFAWGETAPKGIYNWETYRWCMGSGFTLTKYCNQKGFGYNEYMDGKTELDPEDDAATANWGASWRMPTKDECQELLDNTTSEIVTVNGIRGRRFTSSSNGKSIFFPFAGHRFEGNPVNVGSESVYWSLTHRDGDDSWILYPYSSGVLTGGQVTGRTRSWGLSVRPVASSN